MPGAGTGLTRRGRTSGASGADYGECSDERTNQRNGYRTREWDTRAGTVELAIGEALVATGVNTEGNREILGLDVASAEDGAGWLAFLRGLGALGHADSVLLAAAAQASSADGQRDRLKHAGWFGSMDLIHENRSRLARQCPPVEIPGPVRRFVDVG